MVLVGSIEPFKLLLGKLLACRGGMLAADLLRRRDLADSSRAAAGICYGGSVRWFFLFLVCRC